MGAAEDEGVSIVSEDGLQVFAHGEAGHVVIKPAFFHERYEQRAGLRLHARGGILRMDGAGVGVAVDGGVGGNHGDVAVFAGGKRCFGTGGDNVDDGHSTRLSADGLARDGGDGVAGNHQRLDALGEEERDDLRAILRDRKSVV